MRCQIHTAVWGAWHTDIFVGANLPSLLAPNNLPALARQLDTTFVVATKKANAATIERSSAWQKLKQLMKVRIDVYADGEFGAPIATHKKLWTYGLDACRKEQAYCIVNPPDIAWGDGSLATMATQIIAGKKAIYANFPRALEETFIPEADARHRNGDVVTIPPREMVDMMLRHQHPLNAAYLRDGDQFPHHAEHVFWAVPGEGLMMRTLTALIFGMDPNVYDVDVDFLQKFVRDPNDLYFAEDSDGISGVSLAPLNKDQTWYAISRLLDIDEIGSWWLAFDDPAFLPLAEARFYLHTKGIDSPAWRRAKQASDFFVFQTITSREMIRIGRLLRHNGCVIAADLLGTALYAARLRRRWRWRAPVTIVVPDDNALAPHRDEITRRFLAPGNEDALVDLIFGQVAEGVVSGPSATALNGKPLEFGNVRQRIELPQGKQLLIVDRANLPA